MLKNKLILSIIALIIAGIALFILIPSKVPSKDQPAKNDKISSVIKDANQAIGMNLNITDERIKWNLAEKNLILTGKGCFYLDAINAPKLTEAYDNLCKFFENSGFENDSYNSDLNENGSILKKYKKDEIVCNIVKKINPNNTSTVSVACANIDSITYNFNTGEGNECNSDSDCGVVLDACERKRVCRNLKYHFFNDCESPSSLVNDIDFSVAKCQCVSNKCTPKNSGAPSPTSLSD